MKRDMELCRKILMYIEDNYIDGVLFNISIEGYSFEQVAYHCKILFDAGMLSDYKAISGGEHIQYFCVGSLTWIGHEYIEKIRDNTVWDKTKTIITDKGLPMAIDVIKNVSTSIISAMTEGAVKGMVG